MSEMNVGRHDLNLLHALLAMIESGSVTRAAQIVSVSQPAMSRILARLRDDFGDPLLVRSGSGMKRTPRAEALADPVRALLKQAATLYESEAFDPATAQRVFRTAIPDVVAATLLAPLIEAMAREAPGCRIELIPWARPNDPAIATLDFAIGTDTGLFPGLRMTPLFEDCDLLAVHVSQPATWRQVLEMLDAPHVAVVAAGATSDPVDDWLAAQGLHRRIAAVVPHYLQALMAVAQADLVAILPSRVIAAYGPKLDIRAVELPIEQDVARYMLFTPVERSADPASVWLRDLVERTVGD
jgi:DNA-binding transcriptional LysR family regulator